MALGQGVDAAAVVFGHVIVVDSVLGLGDKLLPILVDGGVGVPGQGDFGKGNPGAGVVVHQAAAFLVVTAFEILFVEGFIAVEVGRDELHAGAVYGAFDGGGEHEREGVDHGDGAEDEQQMDAEVEDAGFGVFARYFADDAHDSSPLATRNSMREMCLICMTVKPISMRLRSQAMVVARPNLR